MVLKTLPPPQSLNLLDDAASVRSIVAAVPGDGPGSEVVVVDARQGPATPRSSELDSSAEDKQVLLPIHLQPGEAQPEAPTPTTPETPPEVAMTVTPMLTPVGVDQLFANPALLPKLDQPLPDLARMLGEDSPPPASEAERQDGAVSPASTPLAGAFGGAAMPGPAPAAIVTPPGETGSTAGPPAAAVVPQGQALREAVAGDEQVAEAMPADSAGEETGALPAAGGPAAAPLALGFAGLSSTSDSPGVVTTANAGSQASTTSVVVPTTGAATSTAAGAGATTSSPSTGGTTPGTNLATLASVQQQAPSQATTGDTTSTATSGQSSANAQDLLANLPIRFEANQGQFNSQTQFVAHASSYDLYLGSTQSSFALPGPVSQDANGDPVPGGPGAVVNVQLVGANASAPASGVNQLVTRTNYLIGSDQSQWVTNVPNYASVQYSNVYNGVNLSYYENNGSLEHDFLVAPGANPNQIVSQFSGAQQLSLDGQGDLVIQTAMGSLVEQRPVAYQEVNGTRVAVASNFVLHGDQVRFALGQYDTSRTLVIDPTWGYSSYLGGSGDEAGEGIAVDGTGAAYIVGTTTNPNGIPASGGTVNWVNGPGAGTDIFVAKVAKDGKTLQYLTFMGGTESPHEDAGRGIAVDANGAAYITGYTNSKTFPTVGAWQAKNAGTYNPFVAKLNAAGNTLLFSTYVGGNGDEYSYSIALDANHNEVWIAGAIPFLVTAIRTAPNPPGTAITLAKFGAPTGNSSAFVAGLTSDTGLVKYAAQLGGNGTDVARGIAVDTNGNVYITGETTSKGLGPPVTAFPTTAGAFQTDLTGSGDAFVAEINTAGNLGYSTYFGGAGDTDGQGIALDQFNNAYIIGSTTNGVTPFGLPAKTITPTGIGTPGKKDVYVTRFSPTGDPTAAPYFVLLGGTKDDTGSGIAVQPNATNPMVYITGLTFSDNEEQDFPTSDGLSRDYQGNGDAFVGMLNPSLPPATSLVYNTYVGGSRSDSGRAVTADAAGNVYAVGATESKDMRPALATPGFQTTFGGGRGDAFVVKISPAGVAPPAMRTFNNSPNDPAGLPLSFTVSAQTYDGNAPTYYLLGAPAGAGIDLNSGAFTWTPTFSQVGTWTFGIQADDAEGRFDQQAITVTVNQPTTSTAVTSSANPSSFGQPVTFTATVTPTSGSTMPTGTVTFLDGTAILGTGTLAVVNNQDVASYTTSVLTSGSNVITALYGGDSTFSGSSVALSQVVGQPTGTSSTTSLTSSANPALGGQSVTLTATVQGSGGSPSGTVAFYDGNLILGMSTLAPVGGQMQATYTSSSLPVGSHPLTAIYGGNSTYVPSTAELMQLVNVAQTSTIVSSNDNPATSGDTITFTAVVTSTLGSPPTGSVNFMDGSMLLGTVPLDGTGQATFATSSLAVGEHYITVVYAGNSLTAGNTSNVLDQTVM